MMEMGTAIHITVIGMGLVFGAIAVLWALMAVLVRFTEERAISEAEEAERELKVFAAAAAVSLALASESEVDVHEFPLPSTPLVSAWQAVMRSNMLNKKGQVR